MLYFVVNLYLVSKFTSAVSDLSNRFAELSGYFTQMYDWFLLLKKERDETRDKRERERVLGHQDAALHKCTSHHIYTLYRGVEEKEGGRPWAVGSGRGGAGPCALTPLLRRALRWPGPPGSKVAAQ